MNKTNLKRYAPQARKDFIAAVTARAQLLGLTEVAGLPHAEPCQVNGDVAVIAGRPWPASVQGKRDRLLQRMKRDGYAATLEAVAYTWFNRFAALRYMELHDYLGHGRRVLSNTDGALPEVLSHAVELAEGGDLPGLEVDQVRRLKLDNQDGELYRHVLIAQCNDLHGAMPFLFEAIDDETELLLPDNLLLSDSVVAKLVIEIPEEDWSEVEAIGWLYQFYISEKKEEVSGKVVKSEDIPAATQLFTPNWIVQYLVQNSVGRLWLAANPSSTLTSQWSYYIPPADQTPEVQAQLDEHIQARIREDGGALNPETITVLDPACGSGHILVVAYDVLKAIYLERGYQPRVIPRLILEKNLYGLDIDDRAAQLAAFALLMKARADDRRLFNESPKLNVLSLQESKGLIADELATHLEPFGLQRTVIKMLLDTFEHAKTFGSLIQIPPGLNEQLAAIKTALQVALQDGDLYARQAAKDLLPLVFQIGLLSRAYDVVAANPPYLGARAFNQLLKGFSKARYAGYDKDLFSAFIERGFLAAKSSGYVAIMTSFVWMFLSSFENLRRSIVGQRTLESLVQLEYDAFEDAKAHICTFVARNHRSHGYVANFVRLVDFKGAANQGPKAMEAIRNPDCGWFYRTNLSHLNDVPGSPVAYWLSEKTRKLFELNPVGSLLRSEGQLLTGNNAKYLRQFWEVNFSGVENGSRWKVHHKGGDFRKWYGNVDWVVAWDEKSREFYRKDKTARIPREDLWDLEGVTWSTITSYLPSFRKVKSHESFNKAAPTLIAKNPIDVNIALAVLNSKISAYLLNALNSTLNFLVEDVENLPLLEVGSRKEVLLSNVRRCLELAESDWNLAETSIGFRQHPFVKECSRSLLKDQFAEWRMQCAEAIQEMKALEEGNNTLFIEAYCLQSEMTPDVPEEQITLARADREKDCQRLISYAIGCMMGRYSLDEPGLIYALSGNDGFNPSRYEKRFPADADGILPVNDECWFEDDAVVRLGEFLCAVWGAEAMEENIAWLAESLGSKSSETPNETIRRYLADKFFKDHLQTYKKRPIYWLFSSGKLGAFQALVYMHRYHEGTLARMRSEYVLPLTGKMQARMDSLEVDIHQTNSTVARNKLTKQLEALRKQHHELLAYDEKLRHYADQRIAIDLDDGVKANYSKFGDLLAEVKTVTGGAGDE